MGKMMFFGGVLMALGPLAAVFALTIAKEAKLVILAIVSAFVWCCAITVAAIWWYSIPPLKHVYVWVALFTVFSQEYGRYLMVKMYRRVMNSFARMHFDMLEYQRRMDLQRLQKQQQERGENINNNNNNNGNSNSNNNNNTVGNYNSNNDNIILGNDNNDSDTATTNSSELKAIVAISFGFAFGSCMLMSVTMILSSLGPGSVFSSSCPNTNIFFLSAFSALAIIILNFSLTFIAYNVYLEHKDLYPSFISSSSSSNLVGNDSTNSGDIDVGTPTTTATTTTTTTRRVFDYRPPFFKKGQSWIVYFIPAIHLLASYSTMLNSVDCIAGAFMLYFCVCISAFVAFKQCTVTINTSRDNATFSLIQRH